MGRVAAVHLPCPGLQLRVRERPELRGRPLVLAGKSPHLGRVAECSRRARATGACQGQTLAQARAACPELVVLDVSDEDLADLRREVLEALLQVAPTVEWGGGGTFHVDATGLACLHGSERALLVRCWEAVDELKLSARVGCASTRFIAGVAARAREGPTVVPAGGETEFIAALPLSLLPLTREDFGRLAALGIHTLGQFGRLPADGLSDRFGPEVARFQRWVRGEQSGPLLPLQDPRAPSAVRELESAVEGLEAVVFLLKSCCEELADELERRGTAASRLELRLALDVPRDRQVRHGDATEAGKIEDEGTDVRVLSPSRPLAGAHSLLDLCRLELETRRVRGAPWGIRLTACEEVSWLPAAGELFGLSIDPTALAAVVDRVQALLGPGSALTPSPRPAHRREARVGWAHFDPGVALRREPAAAADGASTGLAERLFASPLPVVVRLPGAGPGEIVLPSTDRLRAGGGLPERAALRAQAGPVRVTGEWWEGGADVDRDEYLLLGEQGGLYRAARDRRTKSWSLLGCLD